MPKHLPPNQNSINNLESLIEAHQRFITSRPHSEAEIRHHFAEYFSSEEESDKFVDLLKSRGFVDDAYFITWWVDQRSEFKQKGKRALSAELYQKGVSKELIDQFFQTHELPESELALSALKKKEARFSRDAPEKRYQRAIAYLLRRGFSYESAKTAFEELFGVK